MIISHELEYVYVGIPRTASKSVSQWLVEYYRGEWFGFHHQWRAPEQAAHYLRFTVVRNPYERSASGMFGMLWGDETPDPAKRVPSKKPPPSDKPLDERIREAALTGNATLLHNGASVPEVGMNQSHFIRKAEISLVLYYERLPECLGDLPFVDRDQIPSLPWALERGIRPAGTFFDHFTQEDERVTWAHAAEDFQTLGYQRFDPMLPESLPNSLWV
jgi:hypothetical protein